MNDYLKKNRKDIDKIDEKLIDLLNERLKLVEEIGKYKKMNNIEILQNDRITEVLNNCLTLSRKLGGDPNPIQEIYKTIINVSCDLEKN